MKDRAFRPRLDGLEDRWMLSMGGGGGSSTLAPVSLAPLSVGIPTFASLTADTLTFTVGTTGLGSGKSLLDVSVIVLDANTGKLLQTLSAQTFVSGSGADSTTGVIPLNNFAPGIYLFQIEAYDGSFQVPGVMDSEQMLIPINPRITGSGVIVIALNPDSGAGGIS